MKMQPTVGRVVYYKSYGTPKGEYKPENRAAIITAVHLKEKSTNESAEPFPGEVDSVDLCVMNPTGMFFNQKVRQGDEGGMWNWMPYQVAQANDGVQSANSSMGVSEGK